MYTGKEPCQGCGKLGSENKRWNKTELCSSCKKEIELGRAKDKELNEEYTQVSAWPNKSALEWRDKTLSNFLMDFLKAVHNPNAETTKQISHPFNKQNIHGGKHFTIPTKLLEPLKEFFEKMDEFVLEIKKEKESLPQIAIDEVKSEKNRIYNEGIERGRNLLFQLDEGSITQKDFYNNIEYRENTEDI